MFPLRVTQDHIWKKWKEDNVFVRRDYLLSAAVVVWMASFVWAITHNFSNLVLVPVYALLVGPVILMKRWSFLVVGLWCLIIWTSSFMEYVLNPEISHLLTYDLLAILFLFLAVSVRFARSSMRDLSSMLRRIGVRNLALAVVYSIVCGFGGMVIEDILTYYGYEFGLLIRIPVTVILFYSLRFILERVMHFPVE